MFKKRRDVPEGAVEEAAIDQGTEDLDLEDEESVEDEEYDEDYEDDEDEEEEPRERDPLVGWMTLVSVMLVLVVVASTAAVVFFLLGMRGAPRTAVERQITSTEAAAKAEPTAENYRALAYAYIAAGRFNEALAQIKKGRAVEDTSEFDLAQADVLRLQEKHEEAVKAYTKAADRNKKETDKEQKALEKRGIFSPVPRTTYVSIMIGLGESLIALDRTDDALEAYSEAVKYDGTNAFALVRVGDLSLELGKTKEAKAAYEEALRFIPGYEPATAGLARLSGDSEE